MNFEKLQVNSTSKGQVIMQNEQYLPTAQKEIVITNEQLRVMFPALYEWEIYSKTELKEIIRQSNERERLMLQGSRSTPNSPTLEHL